jgi:hypothetical protein
MIMIEDDEAKKMFNSMMIKSFASTWKPWILKSSKKSEMPPSVWPPRKGNDQTPAQRSWSIMMIQCDWCHGSKKILQIVEHRNSWVYKPRRCDKCNGFGQIKKEEELK